MERINNHGVNSSPASKSETKELSIGGILLEGFLSISALATGLIAGLTEVILGITGSHKHVLMDEVTYITLGIGAGLSLILMVVLFKKKYSILQCLLLPIVGMAAIAGCFFLGLFITTAISWILAIIVCVIVVGIALSMLPLVF